MALLVPLNSLLRFAQTMSVLFYSGKITPLKDRFMDNDVPLDGLVYPSQTKFRKADVVAAYL